MPFYHDLTPERRPFLGSAAFERPEPAVYSPSVNELLGSAFRQENSVGSLVAAITRSSGGDGAIDPDFDPLPLLEDRDLIHAERFALADSPAEVAAIRRRIELEESDRRNIAASGAAGVAASFAAGLLDPINLLPVGGQIYRGARLGNSVVRSAASVGAAGGLGAAAVEAVLQPTQLTRTWQDSAESVAAGVVLGGVLGAGAPAAFASFAKLRGLAAADDLRQVARAAEDEFAADLRPRPEGQADPLVEPYGVRISATEAQASIDAERAALRDAYAEVKANPNGPADDPLVLIRPEDIEATIVARGGYDKRGDVEVTGQGWGLVKFIWRHGEQSGKAAEKQVTEADVLDFPRVIREYDATEVRSNSREWVVDRADGQRLVYVDRKFAEDNQRRVVSIYVLEDAATKVPSHKRGAGPTGPLDRTFQGPVGGTAGKPFDQLAQSQSGPAPVNIGPEAVPGNLGGGSLSAASPHAGVLHEKLKSAGGIEKITAFQSPMQRLANSASIKARQFLQMVAETPYYYEKNALGIATTHAAETRVKLRQAPLALALAEMDRLWLKHRGVSGGRRLREAADLVRGPTDSGLTRRQFNDEVGRAMRRGDQHEIPEVAAAARLLRQEVFEPLKNDAVELGLLPEGVAVETAASYFSRVYDIQRMKAGKPAFVRTVTDWLEQEQAGKAAIKQRLSELDAERDDLVDLFDKVEAKIGRREKRGGDLAARADETGRSLRTFVQRAFDLGGRRDAARQAATPEAGAADAAADPRAADLAERRLRIRANEADYQGRRLNARTQALFDRMSALEHDLAGLRALRDDLGARMEANADAIAEQVEKWPGKSDTVRKILNTDTARDRAELDDISEQIYDNILRAPGGRSPYEPVPIVSRVGDPAARGAMKQRVFNIPDTLIEPYLISDANVIAQHYVRTMAPDIELRRALGSIDGADWISDIRHEFNVMMRGAKSEAERQRIEKASSAATRDAQALIERLRGTYAAPADPDHWAVRASRIVRDWNYLRLMGMMTVSAIPDLGRPVMVYGLGRVVGQALPALISNPQAFKLLGKETQWAGTALDMVLNSRAISLADIGDDFGRLSKFERGLTAAADTYGVVTLQAPWNAALKMFAGAVASQHLIDGVRAFAKGAADPRLVEKLAMSGISEGSARRIAAQLAEHAETSGSLTLPNTERWSDRSAVEDFRLALVKEVDRTIVTPGIGDRPLWMSSQAGKLIGQFKTFAFASVQRVAISGLQQRDMAALNGMLLLTGLGMASYGISNTLAGREISDDPAIWLSEGIDKAGYTGWLYDANNIVEKFSGGRVGVNSLVGHLRGEEAPTQSRYMSRNVTSALLGPTVGLTEDIARFGGSVFGDWKQSDTRALRRLVPAQNLFYLRQLLDRAEQGANDALGATD